MLPCPAVVLRPTAGVASLLSIYLWNRGMGSDRLHCWAFETPACMDLRLAQACTGRKGSAAAPPAAARLQAPAPQGADRRRGWWARCGKARAARATPQHACLPTAARALRVTRCHR